jgi:hypothetical protein
LIASRSVDRKQAESVASTTGPDALTRSGTVWTQLAYLEASNTQLAFRTEDGSLNDGFGTSVSVSGSTLVVGAYFEFGGFRRLQWESGRQQQVASRRDLHLPAVSRSRRLPSCGQLAEAVIERGAREVAAAEPAHAQLVVEAAL